MAAGESSSKEGRDSNPSDNRMAEPPINADQTSDMHPSGPLSPPQDQPQGAGPLFLSLQPTDDTATVISRNLQQTVTAEDALANVLRGKRLAHYELIEPIGVGGMAAVIRSRDTQLDRIVALKILPREMAGDPEIVRRFHQEARAAAKLDHENIARVFFCGEDQGLHFIAFEFVEGENLKTLLERCGRIPVPQAIDYTLQIATGLAHAGERSVVHRDIKPSNIIISPNGRAKLVDMGLARSLENRGDADLTQSGVTLGTFDYISPEQALEPREADVRSDIYSLGCTLYHMITGRPAVPEGTAARKLHHHQNVDPVDPRGINAEIPDDVALLLSRMMAKDVRARYQTPAELLQHLFVVAQRLGVVTEVPKEAYFGEGPLPVQPRGRPLLLGGLALAALLAFVAIVGPGSWPNSPKPASNATKTAAVTVPEPRQDEPAGNGSELADKPNTLPARTSKETPRYEATDARALAGYLRANAVAHVVVPQDLRLSHDEPLVFDGQELILESADPQRPSTLSLDYDAEPVDEPWAALTIRSGKATIRGIRFVVDSHDADLVISALALSGGTAALEDCEFMQKGSSGLDQGRVSSITVGPGKAGQNRPALGLSHCFFAAGQRALSVSGPASVRSIQCAFGPHYAALFDLQRGRAGANDPEMNVHLQSCSAILTGGCVFRVQDDVACRLVVDHCIISRPASDLLKGGHGTLIEQSGNFPPELEYSGAGNCYHNLSAFWSSALGMDGADKVVSLESFIKCRFVSKDDQSFELSNSPWGSGDPVSLLATEPARAFAVNSTLAELRRPDDTRRTIGMERWIGAKATEVSLPNLAPSVALAARDQEKIVDPSIGFNRDNVYRTLTQALEDAKPGDTILIRHNGQLPVHPLRLEKNGLDVTIKPMPRYHPTLTIGPTTESDAALFRVYDGQLHLEQLEFRLLPERFDFRAQSVAAIMGDGVCTFRDCVATLEEAKETTLSLVTFNDTSGIVKMQTPAFAQTPRVEVTNCFVRGSGNLVTVRASRAFELKIEKTLIALDGSLLAVDGNPKESAGHAHSEVSLNQVTTYLTEALICLRAFKDDTKNSKGLIPTQVRPVTDCLFVSANAGTKALVHLEGIDNDDQMKRCFSWSEGRHNAYGNFTNYLDQLPWSDKDMMPPPAYFKTQWEQFTGEQDGRYDRIRLLAAGEAPFSKVLPSSFKPRGDTGLQGFGVDVERLPRVLEAANTSSN
jgi:serine/threonine protein kinase